MYKPLFLFLLSFLASPALQGQEKYLKIMYNGGVDENLATQIREYEGPGFDSTAIYLRKLEIRELLFENGYFLSSATLESSRKDTAVLYIRPGTALTWKNVAVAFPENFTLPVPQGIRLSNSTASQSGLDQYVYEYLSYLENNGYPFAQLGFESYTVQNDSISGVLLVNPGPYITLDSISVKGFDNFSENVLHYDLNFKKGMTYSEAYVQSLPALINQVEYLSFTRPPAIAFTREKNILFLYMEEVRSNQIDGIIGLNTTEEGEVTFNGDFRLRLLNALKKGEEIRIGWQRPDESISNLEIALDIPYLFKTPFGVGGDLNIFRQDSSFVNTEAGTALEYLIESGRFLSLGIRYRSSNVILDEELSAGDLSLGSFKTTLYRLGYERQATNRAIIPTRGNSLRSYVFTGTRNTADTYQKQYGFEFSDEQYFLFFRNHVLKIGALAEALYGENLFDNELYRIGGLRTLRGFNEQSIYASSYGIGTLEYRYMIGEYDYLTVFSDVAYAERKTALSYSSNWFLGIGTGVNIRTGGGIFSLFLALGRDDQNPFDLRASKIHFGYVNRF